MKAEIIHNKNKGGIEIVFSDKPEDFTNLQLGNLGFKYTKMKKTYFADYSHVLWNAVHDILDEYLAEDKRKVKKEISIPEIDMDIFDETHIKKASTTRLHPLSPKDSYKCQHTVVEYQIRDCLRTQVC